ncbi:MAG: hydroxymethylbilane synthase [Actinomycetota bacterium]
MKTTSKPLVVASRGSRLALKQVEIVKDLLRASDPSVTVEVMVVKTSGDVDQRPFSAISGKGLFTSEVERAVAEGAADFAVHSAKDLTAAIADGCVIACVPPRAPRHDAVVGGSGSTGEERLGSLPEGATVGTSSMRRRALLGEARPDLSTVELRGNLDTRLAKVASGEVDAAILAEAGLARLYGNEQVERGGLGADWWVPPPGQGALALEARADDAELLQLLSLIEHPATRAELECERAFGAEMEGGCSVPLGCLAEERDGQLYVTGFLGLPDGSRSMRDRISGPGAQGAALGKELARAMLDCGGEEIIEELAYEEAPAVEEP